MQRIIYLNDEYGYCVADVKQKQDLQKKLDQLAYYKVEVICVFDVEQRTASYKCKSYELHLQLLKASLPRNFLSKLFNKLSHKARPSYSLVSNLEKESYWLLA
jgi:hypothetical protein